MKTILMAGCIAIALTIQNAGNDQLLSKTNTTPAVICAVQQQDTLARKGTGAQRKGKDSSRMQNKKINKAKKHPASRPVRKDSIRNIN